MRHPALSTALLGIVALSLACGPAPAELSEDDLSSIRTLNERFAGFVQAGDTDSLAALYAEDALLMPPNEEAVSGRRAVADWFGRFDISSFELRPEETGGAGDLAYERGAYSITLSGGGLPGPMSDAGKYLVLLRRQEGAAWVITHDIWNSSQPPPMPAAADTGAADTARGR